MCVCVFIVGQLKDEMERLKMENGQLKEKVERYEFERINNVTTNNSQALQNLNISYVTDEGTVHLYVCVFFFSFFRFCFFLTF